MRINIGEYEVLFSGTIIGIEDIPIELHFPEESASLHITIIFRNDPTVDNAVTDYRGVADQHLEIHFINFNNSLGIGNTELNEIGFIQNRKLYLNYRIYHIKDISKTLHYTFYLGKEGSHGN